jgi:hypothetical protein
MKEVLKNTDKMFSLELDDVGRYVLHTMSGGVGMFEVSLILDSEEVQRFEVEGSSFIEDLAYEVGRNMSKYENRFLK